MLSGVSAGHAHMPAEGTEGKTGSRYLRAKTERGARSPKRKYAKNEVRERGKTVRDERSARSWAEAQEGSRGRERIEQVCWRCFACWLRGQRVRG